MSVITPPNIWRYEECNSASTEGANMKEYKPTGQFYSDANLLCNLFGIKPHPVFREPQVHSSDSEVGQFEDQKKPKEPTTISIMKHRIDQNSRKVLFKVLEGCPHINT